ncbi:DNA-deoxyinosine glycosylase [Paludibacterium paludis]|uniref:DNA-deoxyinosine glycosylase n=1 Tax=Paludibacterium paludis TaxID=1225769 RepID=A0A918P740_9NEIS|nr:DNA-deoxyinosine glycosylase [Paludibacterium paludis]GGY25523.1 DNA-deoxyinosine glycosylase [Paludibacterium paludis]
MKRCFAPVVDSSTRVLLLGSLPGDASLRAGQYYGHPRNQFWMLMGDVLGAPLPDMDYPERLTCLLAHGVGLWDVVAEAHRPGSLDTAIRDFRQNDLITLLEDLPDLAAIGFNGTTAHRVGLRALGRAAAVPCLLLPSSSPAHAVPYLGKLAAWRELGGFLGDGGGRR